MFLPSLRFRITTQRKIKRMTCAEVGKEYLPVKLAFDVVEPDDMDEDKNPIIFLHGMSLCKENWTDIPHVMAMETKRRAYVLDARNHGDSEWSDTFNFDCNTTDLINFMDERDIPRAVLVGHSMGGLASYKAALKAPERVEKLLVEDMSVKRIPQFKSDSVLHWMKLEEEAVDKVPPELDDVEAKKFIVRHIFDNVPEEMREQLNPDKIEQLLDLKRDDEGRHHFKTNHRVLMAALAMGDGLMTDLFGVYDGPACVVYGELSYFPVGQDEEKIKEFFPKAEMVCFEKATHTVHSDCPSEFKDVLLNFLNVE